MIRFRRRVKILPGVQLTLGMRSAGISVGPRGLHVGYNTHHGAYASAGLPGSGLYGLTYLDRGEGARVTHSAAGAFVTTFVITVMVVLIIGYVAK